MRPPYDRRFAGRAPGRAAPFPPGAVDDPRAVRREWRRANRKPLIVMVLFIVEATAFTANAFWWHRLNSGPAAVAVCVGNAVLASLFVLWMRKRRR